MWDISSILKVTTIKAMPMDAFYGRAKEEGWRARNGICKESNDVRRVVDLCAAPGSWSQVLRHRLPSDAEIVAVDLQDMAPIEGVQQVKGDITKEATQSVILENLSGLADLVVCDGAPDVTGLHEVDVFVQSQLLESAFALTSRLLRHGGSFVAKVFRTGDNDDSSAVLSAQLECLFDHVNFSKPPSSRPHSCEAFVVCRGFKTIPLESSFSHSLLLSSGDLSGYE